MSQENLVRLIKEQIKIENAFKTDVTKQIKNIHNQAAKLLLLETQKDSEKHAMILEGILSAIDQKGAKLLWHTILDSYVDKEIVRRNLEEHVETEMAMLKHIEKAMKETKDEGIRLLLEHIGRDEKKHHEILQTVIKQAYKIKP
ncbi:MAG: hypothetical protein JSV51_00060 [Candidatus Bathyarchaeota archaeon]|nr:MAG: hypothetical protein JSV51_00060 [Candidatus Bathyarchaeota archaeon]